MKAYLWKPALLLLLFLLMFTFQSQGIWRWMYPIYYPGEVRQAAEKYRINPNLIIAIIQTESRFLHGRNSAKGAVGLMQLMKETADWIVDQGGFENRKKDFLNDPKVNIELGSWYLRYLLNLYGGNLVLTIAAYNAGPGTVSNWLQMGIWNGEYATISRIPYGETRHYIQRVLYIFERYEQTYNQNFWDSVEYK
ncbi:conserved hypothetical protein [[Clostridium] ultunense Esp]|uniref:lytic transglycosylase domain-containing protein n=1 Tax=Thermicanus aegyptius TaxID=94009 RepID=UPI0002B6EFED|nr:lytic transglycosylase domain-containing protein [Thermicanus aegyptius]CCQ93606.1 conserved hypothetical protein [[Clostridium] ultunense Esp]